MKKLVFLFSCFITSVLSAQEPKPKIALQPLTHESIKLQTDQIFNKLVKIRRDFHEHPELAGNEVRT